MQHLGVQSPQLVLLLGLGDLRRQGPAQDFQRGSPGGASSTAARMRAPASASMTTKASSRVSK